MLGEKDDGILVILYDAIMYSVIRKKPRVETSVSVTNFRMENGVMKTDQRSRVEIVEKVEKKFFLFFFGFLYFVEMKMVCFEIHTFNFFKGDIVIYCRL